MPLVGAIQDDFTSGTLAATWSSDSSGTTVVSGRARVVADTGFGNGMRTGFSYTLVGSSVYAQLYAPDPTGSVDETNIGMFLTGTTGGSDLGILINTTANTISFLNRVSYFDGSGVSITYDSTAHRWVRLAEASGTVTFQTSPDGITWTTRRTVATPSWMTSTQNLQLGFNAYKKAGTASYAEVDNINITQSVPVDGGGQTASNLNLFNRAGSVPSAQLAAYPTQLGYIENTPSGIWLAGAQDYTSQINADYTAAAGKIPVFVLYMIPIRDNSGFSGGGWNSSTEYSNWIDQIATAIGSRTAWIVLEPDALGMITSLAAADQTNRYNMLSAAVTRLKLQTNVKVYIDASPWVGATDMAGRLAQANIAAADGFATNISQFRHLTDDGANSIYPWAEALLSALVARGITGKKYVVDTGRNGQGELEQSLVAGQPWRDRGLTWCNPPARGLGLTPRKPDAQPNCDALLWIKPPGESDGPFPAVGESGGYFTTGAPGPGGWWTEYAVDLYNNRNTTPLNEGGTVTPPGTGTGVVANVLDTFESYTLASTWTTGTSPTPGNFDVVSTGGGISIQTDGGNQALRLAGGTTAQGSSRLFVRNLLSTGDADISFDIRRTGGTTVADWQDFKVYWGVTDDGVGNLTKYEFLTRRLGDGTTALGWTVLGPTGATLATGPISQDVGTGAGQATVRIQHTGTTITVTVDTGTPVSTTILNAPTRAGRIAFEYFGIPGTYTYLGEFAASVTTASTEPPPPPPPPVTVQPIATLQDPFTTLAGWKVSPAAPASNVPSIQVVGTDSRVLIPASNAGDYPNVQALAQYYLAGSSTKVRMFPPTVASGLGQLWLSLATGPGVELRWAVQSNNQVRAEVVGGGGNPYAVTAQMGPTALSSMPTWFKIAESGGTITWSYSYDDAVYTTFWTQPVGSFTAPLNVTLLAWSDAGFTAPASVSSIGISETVAVSAGAASTLQDSFTGTTPIDATKWVASSGVTKQNETLVASALQGSTSSLSSINAYDLRNSHYLATVTPAGAPNDVTYFQVQSATNPANYLRFEIVPGTSKLRMAINGETAPPETAYTVGVHKWFRIREASGQVLWETSADGLAWTIRRGPVASPSWVALSQLVLSATNTTAVVQPPPPPPPVDSGATSPPDPGTATFTATVNFNSVEQITDPTFLGMGSSTYGANPLTSQAQNDIEYKIDARFVRLPVGFRNGRVTTSAAGANTSLDMPALLARYKSWGYRAICVVGGRTSDWDVSAGDATTIFNALGNVNIDYSPSNEPDNQGKNVTDVTNQAMMIYNEGVTKFGQSFKLWGPVLVDWYGGEFDGTRGFMNTYTSNMGGAQRLAGLDWHAYGAGMGAGPTAKSTQSYFDETTKFTNMTVTQRNDMANRGIPKTPGNTNLDETNFRWIYEGDPRFFQGINTVWLASVIQRVLRAGGRVMPYATQNGALGIMVEGGNNDQGRPASTPQPAYYAIAAFTGERRFSHFKDRIYTTTSTDGRGEAFAVNNEALGYNIVMINKDEFANKIAQINMTGVTSGTYEVYQTRKNNPYDAPVKSGPYTFANSTIKLAMPACTVTTIVLKSGV